MVLRIHVVRQGGHHYYVDDLVPGRAEDSRVAGEEPGTWVGDGARSLGLSGPVVSPSFAEVLEGRDPASGRTLRVPRGERSVAGYDLTFCAPKSVSLLHLLAPREIAEAAGAGHHRAVADALDYLGREGVGVRRTRHGIRCPFSGPQGRWPVSSSTAPVGPSIPISTPTWWWPTWPRGSTGRGRRGQPSTASPISVPPSPSTTPACGSSWATAWGRRGRSVPRDWATSSASTPGCAGSSRSGRRRWTSSGTDGGSSRPGGARVAAFHADRPEKDRTVTVEALMAEWKQRAVDLGFDLGDLTRSVGVHARPDDVGLDRGRLRGQLLALTGEHRVIGRRHLVAALAASTEGGATARDVEMAAARLMEACGAHSPTRDGAELGGGYGRSAAEPRWDPAHVLRVVDGLRFEDTWRDTGPADPTGHPALDLVRAPTPELGRGPGWAAAPSGTVAPSGPGPSRSRPKGSVSTGRHAATTRWMPRRPCPARSGSSGDVSSGEESRRPDGQRSWAIVGPPGRSASRSRSRQGLSLVPARVPHAPHPVRGAGGGGDRESAGSSTARRRRTGPAAPTPVDGASSKASRWPASPRAITSGGSRRRHWVDTLSPKVGRPPDTRSVSGRSVGGAAGRHRADGELLLTGQGGQGLERGNVTDPGQHHGGAEQRGESVGTSRPPLTGLGEVLEAGQCGHTLAASLADHAPGGRGWGRCWPPRRGPAAPGAPR